MARGKKLEASGLVSELSSRVAKSGKQAHSFKIGKKKFTFFIEDPMHPLIEGDVVRFSYVERTLQGRYKRRYNDADLESLVIDAPSGVIDTGDASNPNGEAGFIYIASNAGMPGLLKIGYTNREPAQRVAELSSATGVPKPFKLEWMMPVQRYAERTEGLAHSKLASSNAGKEFFRVSLAEAQDACRSAYLALDPDGASRLEVGLAERASQIKEARENRDARIGQWNAEQDQLKRKRAWERSSDSEWRLRGNTRWILEDFDPNIHRGYISPLGKLLGKRSHDYLELRIVCLQHRHFDENDPDSALYWQVGGHGIANGKHASLDLIKASSFEEALERTFDVLEGHPARNRRISVEIKNANLANPDESRGLETPVSVDTVIQALTRMKPVPKERNGACPPEDWASDEV